VQKSMNWRPEQWYHESMKQKFCSLKNKQDWQILSKKAKVEWKGGYYNRCQWNSDHMGIL
jgi:hypothetical protein